MMLGSSEHIIPDWLILQKLGKASGPEINHATIESTVSLVTLGKMFSGFHETSRNFHFTTLLTSENLPPTTSMTIED